MSSGGTIPNVIKRVREGGELDLLHKVKIGGHKKA